MKEYNKRHANIKVCCSTGIENQLLSKDFTETNPFSAVDCWKKISREDCFANKSIEGLQVMCDEQLSLMRKTFLAFSKKYITFRKHLGAKKIFYFFFFYSSILWAQNGSHIEHNDILFRIKKTLCYQAKENIDSLNTILKQSNNVCMQAYGMYYDASSNYQLKNEIHQTEKKLLECIANAQREKLKMHIDCYEGLIRQSSTKLFFIYRREGEYEKALNIISKYKNVFQSNEFRSFVGINQYDLQNYEKAIIEFKSFLKNPPKLYSLYSIANTHSFIGDAYVQLYKKTQNATLLDSANAYYKHSLTIGNIFNKNIPYNSALYYSRLAKIEYCKKNYAKSVFYYQKYFDHPIMQQNSFTYQLYCIGLAENYLHLKKPDSTIQFLIKLDSAYTAKSGSEEYYIAGLSAYMDAYQQKGDDKKALHYAKLYLDEIKKLESNKAKAHKLVEVLNIKQSNDKAQKIINSRNNWLIFISLIGIVLVLLLFVIVKIYKFKAKQEQVSYKQIIKSMKEQIELKDIQLSIEEIEENPEKSKYLTDIKEFERIQKKLIKLEKNKEFLNPNFKLPYLAKKIGTNTAYLSAFFNYYLEKGFNQYLQEKRMTYLLELLENESVYHKYSVQAISEHIGYKSPSAFRKVFKDHTGNSISFYLKNKQ